MLTTDRQTFKDALDKIGCHYEIDSEGNIDVEGTMSFMTFNFDRDSRFIEAE